MAFRVVSYWILFLSEEMRPREVPTDRDSSVSKLTGWSQEVALELGLKQRLDFKNLRT